MTEWWASAAEAPWIWPRPSRCWLQTKERAEDYLGLNKVPGPGLPKIMVPTTAGTGSEVTFTAVFIRKETQEEGRDEQPRSSTRNWPFSIRS